MSVLVTFPVVVIKYPDKSNFREEGLILSTFWGTQYSPLWQGHTGSRVKAACHTHLQSGNREIGVLMLCWLSPF